jgi:hypothetical protein
MHTTSTVLMVPPRGFCFNIQTAMSNAFQQKLVGEDVKTRAMSEFNAMVDSMTRQGVNVILLNQHESLPDAVFPNNWFSTHRIDKQTILILYPMLTVNRQAEVNRQGLLQRLNQHDILIDEVIDLSKTKGVLEGTGSLVFDRVNKYVYASISPRTHTRLVEMVAKQLGYLPVLFESFDAKGMNIYHTNVMMSVGEKFVVVCLEAIVDKSQRQYVEKVLSSSAKTIIPISLEQVNHMCGNVIELCVNPSLVLMSKQAYRNFNERQRLQLLQFANVLPVDIHTIETIGGGSARCMVAEVFV